MKNLLYLLLAFSLVACSKSDNYDVNLIGSTWKFEKVETDGRVSSHVLSFSLNAHFTQDWTLVSKEGTELSSATWSGTYIYNHPYLTLFFDEITIKATVSANTIQYHGGDNRLFLKQ